jgi:hypothetical protein
MISLLHRRRNWWRSSGDYSPRPKNIKKSVATKMTGKIMKDIRSFSNPTKKNKNRSAASGLFRQVKIYIIRRMSLLRPVIDVTGGGNFYTFTAIIYNSWNMPICYPLNTWVLLLLCTTPNWVIIAAFDSK